MTTNSALRATQAAMLLSGVACACLAPAGARAADESPRTIEIWKGLPPGETTLSPGETLARRPNEDPPATRIGRITQPLLEVYEPGTDKRTGTAVVILPGGGYNYVVTDKEGSEPARWLNELGITAYVLRYRTKDSSNLPPWKRPVQDAQRAVSLLRAHAADWRLDPRQIGLLGFSAGGQAAAIAATRFEERAYAPVDEIDKQSCRPDFALLVYPWNLWDAKQQKLFDEVRPSARTPPLFLVHAHDDSSSALGSVSLYMELKKAGVPAELHIYHTGGHGYGVRPVAGSVVHTWPQRAEAWLSLLPKPAAGKQQRRD